ncbi:MAG: glycosyltransferase family 4 protein [Microgenomates group bacterium]
MVIGIDGNEANVKMKVGVSVYTLNLLKHFCQQANKNLQFKIFLKEPPRSDLPAENKYFHYEVIPGKFLWSQIFLPIRLNLKKDVDIFFSPAHYLPRFCPLPAVVTIHDLSFLFYPDDFLKTDLIKLRQWTQYSVKNAKKIIAVSKTTKKDIVKNYQIPERKIEVIYNGYEKNLNCQTSIRKLAEKNIYQKLKIEKNKYILYVGTLQPRKNLTTLIEAFKLIIKLYNEFKLVIVGKKGWLYKDIFQKVKSLGLANEVVFTDYLEDQQLISLYQNAFCFILPSFYEGFGIPILEAMSFGCPVIASFTASLPEIGGDACLYFDPNNVDDLVEKLKLLKEDRNLRGELIKKGKERVKLFSWEKCGRETLEVIKSLAK